MILLCERKNSVPVYVRLSAAIMKTNKKNIENKKSLKEGDKTKQREKIFDKKKYRLQKYSNKYKVNQWEERRKRAIIRNFHKELKKDQKNLAQANSSNASKDTDNKTRSEADNFTKKPYVFYKAKQESERIKEEKRKKAEEAMRAKTEREEALKKYKEKKIRTYKILSQKNKKGQPIMKGRLEMLLEKIQQNLT